MKRYIYILLGYLLLGTIVSSCNRKSTFDEESFFINAIDHAQISNSYKWIVIIPGAGCSGCIQEGEFFIGRTEFDSPEVDCEVLIPVTEGLTIGKFYNVDIVDSDEYDLYGTTLK